MSARDYAKHGEAFRVACFRTLGQSEGGMGDDEFLAAFEACSVPKAEWTHEAHVRMAWLYLSRLPFGDALGRIGQGIRRYNAAVGGPPSAYHETVTVAFARLVHARMAEGCPGEGFATFAARSPDLFWRGQAALLRHYSRAALDSPAARDRFVEPDLEPLPPTSAGEQAGRYNTFRPELEDGHE